MSASTSPWRWMPGMCDTEGRRVVADPGHGHYVVAIPDDGAAAHYSVSLSHRDYVLGSPDWEDLATLGCLAAQVREAWGPGTVMTESVDYPGAYEDGQLYVLRLRDSTHLFGSVLNKRVDRLLEALHAAIAHQKEPS